MSAGGGNAVPVGPEPQALSAERLAEIRSLLRYETSISFHSARAKESMLLLLAEVEQWRATYGRDALPGALARLERAESRVAELEAERAKYVGKEPTIAEEMAYLSRCIHAVGELELPEKLKVDTISADYRSGYVHALADMRMALESPERSSYPPALPWARLMDHEDLTDFLDELAASAITHASSEVALAEVEKTCGTWRLTAEAQHGHNTAPGPDAVTRTFVPVASLREEGPGGEHYPAVHHTYRLGHDLPETGGAR